MAQLLIRDLGPLQVSLNGKPVTGFDSDKVRGLLVYLAVECDRPHAREKLAGLLWPDYAERSARTNLRSALANLRKVIGDKETDIPYLLISRQAIQFNQTSDYVLESDIFKNLVEGDSPAINKLVDALTLYKGRFIEGFSIPDSILFEEWVLIQREALQLQYLDLLSNLVVYYSELGTYDQALDCARRMLSLDPYLEEAHRQVMRILALGGQRNEALNQYETCQRLLADELGVEPAEETTQLYQAIKENSDLSTSPTLILQDRTIPEHAKPLIGRKHELVQIAQLMDTDRLITLCGPGGVGKTRLAIAVAEAQSGFYRQGVHFVPLLSLNSPTAIVPAIANVLGLTLLEGRTPEEQLLDYLRLRQMLLVLDNMEHLLLDDKVERTLTLVEAMLTAAPGLSILVTSRELLRLSAEQAYLVQGLPIGDGEVDVGEDQSAVELFRLHAQRVQPDFKLDSGENLRFICQICRLVEGMPLAIELAASQLRLLSLTELITEIEGGLDVLDTGMRGIGARHRSIRAVFETTWRNLEAETKFIFARLSVFQGGFTSQAASHVAQARISDLASLLDKSLLQRNTDLRFVMHALTQLFAAEKLEGNPVELAETQERHYRNYRQSLNTAISRWREAYNPESLDQIDPEVDNLRAGWNWIVSKNDWDEVAAYMDDLWHYFKVRGRLPEAMELLDQALLAGQAAEPAASRVHQAYWECRLGQAYLWLSHFREGDDHFRRTISLLEWSLPGNQIGLLVGILKQLLIQALHRVWPGYFVGRLKHKHAGLEVAFIAYQRLAERAVIENDSLMSVFCAFRSLNLAEAAGLRHLMAQPYGQTGYMFGLMRLHGLAEYYLKLAKLTIQQETSPEVQEPVWMLIGIYYAGIGKFKQAEDALTRSVDFAGILGKHWVQGTSWVILLLLCYLQGEFDRSMDYAQRIGIIAQQTGDLRFEAAALYWEAVIKLQKDEMDDVVSLLEESTSAPPEVMNEFDWITLHAALAKAYCRQDQLELAQKELEKVSNLLADISYPMAVTNLYGYSETAEVYLAMWETQSGNGVSQNLQKLARGACKNLHFFAKIFPIAKPLAWLYQGLYDWLAGNPRKAHKAWQRSLLYSQEMENPYQQGLVHYEIGRKPLAGQQTEIDWGPQQHLERAAQIFTQLGAMYDLNLVNKELRKLKNAS